MSEYDQICKKVKAAIIKASSMYRPDQIAAFQRAIKNEKKPEAKWVLDKLLENACVAGKNNSPLCDDTGIPHLLLEIGKTRALNGEMLEALQMGVKEGLRELPGRPMAIKGTDTERLEQTGGLDVDPGAMVPAPIIVKKIDQDIIRLHVLLQGGGPEIRGRTYRVFHKHKLSVIIDEIVRWAKEEVSMLGCTPCSLAIGIGRSHFEAASLMIEAMTKADFSAQSDIEVEITEKVNDSMVGPLGLGGKHTALATFLNVGPQRASGVRIVCLRLCCCVEPRTASVLL